MNNYSDKSDFEVNCAIAHIIFNVVQIIPTIGEDSIMVVYVGDDGNDKMTPFPIDYCNNPADSWRLMVKMVSMGFDVIVRKHIVKCFKPGFKQIIQSEQLSAGRSMAECFLMIKGGEV